MISFLFISDVPGVPYDFRYIKLGKSHVTLEWRTPHDDGGSKILKYSIKMKKDKKSDWEKLMTVDGNERNCKVTDLEEGQEYYFAVCAENKKGSGKLAEMPGPVIPKKEPSKLNLFLLIFHKYSFM